MIQIEFIEKLINDFISSDYYLVELNIKAGNLIEIQIDTTDIDQSVGISYCVKLSRHIESHFDRDLEDFQLQVSSAGITSDFKHYKQFEKNIGKDIEIITKDGQKIKGCLAKITKQENGEIPDIEVETETLQKIEGKKRKETVIEIHNILRDNIKSVKPYIDFFGKKKK